MTLSPFMREILITFVDLIANILSLTKKTIPYSVMYFMTHSLQSQHLTCSTVHVHYLISFLHSSSLDSCNIRPTVRLGYAISLIRHKTDGKQARKLIINLQQQLVPLSFCQNTFSLVHENLQPVQELAI